MEWWERRGAVEEERFDRPRSRRPGLGELIAALPWILVALAPISLAALTAGPAPAAPRPASSLASRLAQATVEVPSSRAALTPYQPHYHTLTEIRELFDTWAGERPEALRSVWLPDPDAADPRSAHGGQAGSELGAGSSRDGEPARLEVPLVEIFGPGDTAPEDRPVVLILGGLDGTSLVGGEVVLALIADLLADPDTLPPTVTFLAAPWAAPTALGVTATGRAHDGRGAEPVDEDRDGFLDEDGPDDIDGDGILNEMLVPDPEGAWTHDVNGLALRRASPGDAPRFSRTLEGEDDDGDGFFNEDGPGGIVIDRSFPIGRDAADPLAGALPMSPPLARAYAKLVLEREVAVVVVLGGDHGRLAIPGGVQPGSGSLQVAYPAREDLPVYERLTAIYAERMGRPQQVTALRDARQSDRPGAAIDWLYVVPGALAFELAPWGPRLGWGETAVPEELPSELDAAWLAWIDNARGGLGFSPWRPVELGDGRRGLVGGFEPFTRTNPPVEDLPAVVGGYSAFVREVVDAFPRLELSVVEARRDKDLLYLRARVRNNGLLPTGLWATQRWRRSLEGLPTASPGGGVDVHLVLPGDARLLAGPQSVRMGRLGGSSSSRDLEWLVLAPQGSTLSIEASAPWCLPVRREIRR